MKVGIGFRPLAAATALLFLLGLVGLATVDDEGGSTVITAAADATTAKGTARMAMVISFGAGQGQPQQSTMSGEGLIDMGANRARMTLDSPLLGGKIEILVDGTTAYVNAGSLPQLRAVSGGKPWIVVDADSAGAGAAFGTNGLGGSSDPLQWFRLLKDEGIAGDVEEKGVEDVRGAQTTRYAADLDVEALLEAVGSPQAAALAQAADQASGEVEVWLADDGTVRRTVFRMAFGAFVTTVTVELFDFGVAAEGLEPPPADQVHRIEQ